MTCPTCGSEDTRVLRTLPSSDLVIRVQRCATTSCPRFETHERVRKVLPVAVPHATGVHGQPPPTAIPTPANTERLPGACEPKKGFGVSVSDLVLIPASSGPSEQSDPKAITRSDQARAKGPAYSDAFECFWAAYPRRVGKGAAWRAWPKAAAHLDAILVALDWQRICDDWQRDGGAYVPHPATWLNARRWEDEPTTQGPRIPEKDRISRAVTSGWLVKQKEGFGG